MAGGKEPMASHAGKALSQEASSEPEPDEAAGNLTIAPDGETLLDNLAALLEDADRSLEQVSLSSTSEPGLGSLVKARLDRARCCLRLLRTAWSRPLEPDCLSPDLAGRVISSETVSQQNPATGDEETTGDPGRLPHVSDPVRGVVSGSRKIGRFIILKELGQGGFGIVYLAEDPILGRLVALKLPRLQVFESPELTRRFVLEAQAAARLDHPNVVSIYDVGELGPEPGSGLYIASAYCSEGSLAAWIARQSAPVGARQAADLLIKLAEGVQHLHDHGILHRDLKPSNVLLQRSSSPQSRLTATGAGTEDLAGLVPRIGDFGLARLREGSPDQTLSGHPIGSPSYMSPEQAEGRISALGPATDVYGLGTSSTVF